VDTESGKESRFIIRRGVNCIDFSPRDTYLITCQKFVEGEKNLVLWDIKSGTEAIEFPWKKSSKEGPKSVKFSKDENYCARIASKTTIEIYKDHDFQKMHLKLAATADNLEKKKTKDQVVEK
jgi:uncharacterized protein with WD repeat